MQNQTRTRAELIAALDALTRQMQKNLDGLKESDLTNLHLDFVDEVERTAMAFSQLPDKPTPKMSAICVNLIEKIASISAGLFPPTETN